MTRVALVNLASLPMPGNQPVFPIGLRCVQEALDTHGHRTRLIDFVADPHLRDDLSWLADGWDVVGFTIRNIDPLDLACDGHVPHYVSFVAQVRAALGHRRPVLVGGGPGYSLFADALLAALGLDVGVVGPGEAAMLDIAADPERYRRHAANLQGRPYARFGAGPLTHPARLAAAYLADPAAMIGVETRRKTCYQGCTYCPYAYIDGQDAGDLKPPHLIVQELHHLHGQGVRRVFFTDSIFNAELRYAKQVVGAVRDAALEGLTWSGYFTPKPFDDEFAALLTGSGVEFVVISPDSLDDGMMRTLGKSFSRRHVDRCLARCRRHGLELRVNVVFGGPGETAGTLRTTTQWINDNLRAQELSMGVGYRVLPGTALARQLRLSPEDLLNPTFYPFPPDLFSWLMSSLDSRFLTTTSLLNLLAARSSALGMQDVVGRDAAATSDGIRAIARPVPAP